MRVAPLKKDRYWSVAEDLMPLVDESTIGAFVLRGRLFFPFKLAKDEAKKTHFFFLPLSLFLFFSLLPSLSRSRLHPRLDLHSAFSFLSFLFLFLLFFLFFLFLLLSHSAKTPPLPSRRRPSRKRQPPFPPPTKTPPPRPPPFHHPNRFELPPPQGHFDDVAGISKALEDYNKRQPAGSHEVGLHVDGASGGFIAATLFPHLQADFRSKSVISVNLSGHKTGQVVAGVGWAMFRSRKYLPESLVFHDSYLGNDQISFTLNFSKGASQIIGQA